MRSTAYLTPFLMTLGSTFTPHKNYTTILTISLIGWKIDTSFVLTNQQVVAICKACIVGMNVAWYSNRIVLMKKQIKFCPNCWNVDPFTLLLNISRYLHFMSLLTKRLGLIIKCGKWRLVFPPISLQDQQKLNKASSILYPIIHHDSAVVTFWQLVTFSDF